MARFGNPGHMSPKDQKALITALKSCQKCRQVVNPVKDIAKAIKDVQSMDGKRYRRLVLAFNARVWFAIGDILSGMSNRCL